MMVCLLQQDVKKIKQNKKIFKDAFRYTSKFNRLSLVAKANLKQKAKMTGKMSKQRNESTTCTIVPSNSKNVKNSVHPAFVANWPDDLIS